MPYRLNPSYSNQYYHVYNCGNNRRKIFFEKRNYSYFLQKITKNFYPSIELAAFCLMPNHYHLIIKINKDNSLEKAMQKIATGYTRAINKAYGRTGHLFEGRYKNKIIPDDKYLIHLLRYIHLNPLRAKLVTKIGDWEFSSYLDHLGNRNPYIINKNILENYFGSLKLFVDFHNTFQEEQNCFIKDLLFN